MFLNNVVLLLTIIVVLLFSCVMHIKNEVTYKNNLIISRAIYFYNIDRISKGDIDGILSYDVIKSYDKAFINMFDWGYKNLVPKDTYALIEPFIEKG